MIKNIVMKYVYKKMFNEMNLANYKILSADKWEGVHYSFPARPPYTWEKNIRKYKLITEYFDCVNLSYRTDEKVKVFYKELMEKKD